MINEEAFILVQILWLLGSLDDIFHALSKITVINKCGHFCGGRLRVSKARNLLAKFHLIYVAYGYVTMF